MKILAVDTSTDVCSVCALDGDHVAGEYVSKSAQTHTERLLPSIERLMHDLSWKFSEMDCVAVIHGPGSFTGLRIGLSVVKGLSLGLGLPVVMGNALEIAAMQVEGSLCWICPVMDARRGEVFTCLFEVRNGGPVLVQKPVSIRPEEMKSFLPQEPVSFCGPGAWIYRDKIETHSKSQFVFQEFVLARTLAYDAHKKFLAGETVSGVNIRAAYLRPSDAETKGARPPRKHLGHVSRG